MDILITESQLRVLTGSLNEAYSRTFINRLITKFKLQNPEVSTNKIEYYIDEFHKITQKLQNKDINTYSWDELVNTVDTNKSKRIKAGKIDKTQSDTNLIYNKDGIIIYQALNRNACIKYGHGYHFCISARGDGDSYQKYRVEKNGTPYFIFNDNLSNEEYFDMGNDQNEFEDPNHLLVLFVYQKEDGTLEYSITDADNYGESVMTIEQIIDFAPWIKNPFEQGIFKPIPVSKI